MPTTYLQGMERLVAEYERTISLLSPDAGDAAIIHVLKEEADWTETGARELVFLSQTYGTSILRNALALAEAMGIEDGSEGL